MTLKVFMRMTIYLQLNNKGDGHVDDWILTYAFSFIVARGFLVITTRRWLFNANRNSFSEVNHCHGDQHAKSSGIWWVGG